MIVFLKTTFRPYLKRFRFWLSATNNPLFISYYRIFYKPKKGSVHEFLDILSKSKPMGLQVIQIGANDGITHDPIHKFIKRDKWKGVLLEPQHYVFETFLIPIYRRNKDIVPLCAALGSEMGKANLYKIGFSQMRWATGLASFNKDNVQKAFDSGLVASRCKKHGIQIPEDDSKWIVEEEVPVITPEHILKEYEIQNIDLLQIDAEGFDFEVIKIFDIPKTRPESIVFEHVHLNQKDKAECFNLLEEQGYHVKLVDSNALATRSMNPLVTSFFRV